MRQNLQRAQVNTDQNPHSKITSIQGKLEKAGQALLIEAEQHSVDGNHLQALRLYRILSIALSTTATGRTAKIKLLQAERDPAVRAAAHEVQAAALWDLIIGVVNQYEAGRAASAGSLLGPKPTTDANIQERIVKMPIDKQASIMATLRTITTRYARCDTGGKATDLTKGLKSDKAFAKSFAAFKAAQGAQRKFKMATTYEKARRYSKAAELYDKIIKANPDTNTADEARKKLRALDGKYLRATAF